jgi:hypothetical protein
MAGITSNFTSGSLFILGATPSNMHIYNYSKRCRS